jgi:hypothetical protein
VDDFDVRIWIDVTESSVNETRISYMQSIFYLSQIVI